MPITKNPKLLLPAEYLQQATSAINKATSRVMFMALMITEDNVTDDFIDALGAAAERGIEVQIAADVFTYGELGGHFYPTKFFTKRSRATTSMVRHLTAKGVEFKWLGRFSSTPFTGRTHIKGLVVDDMVYSFGGVNLHGVDISNNTDYMFAIRDERLADDLSHEFSQIAKADGGHYAYRSHEFSYGQNSVLTDGGFQGDSIIYRRACDLTRDAKKVILVSQYCPTGKLSRLLKQKKRGAKLYFNPPELADKLNRKLISVGMFLSKHKTNYKRKKYLHAKFMIFEMPNGSKVALTGSHNFVYAGVLLGTREIALETRDPKIIKQLEQFLHSHVD